MDVPYVLEYNVRMGDPECQPITMRMNFDLYDYFVASVDGTLSSMPSLSWKDQFAVCVVLASNGYPGFISLQMMKLLDLILFQMKLMFFMLELKNLMEKFFLMVDVFWELLL